MTHPQNSGNPPEELLLFILPHGKAEDLLHYIKEKYAKPATVLQGRGTRPEKWLKLLGLAEQRREILLLSLPQAKAVEAAQEIRHQFHLDHPGEGIAIGLPLLDFTNAEAQYEAHPYRCLCLILNQDLGEEAVEVAQEAGASGATVIPAQGTAEQADKIFDFIIQEEKALILMILKKDEVEAVKNKLHQHFSLDEANTGIQYSLPVKDVIGLYEEEK